MVRFGPISLQICRDDRRSWTRSMQWVRLYTANLLLIAGLIGVLASPARAAAIYEASNDFSVASNPNGVWSYLYSISLPTTTPLPLGQGTCNGLVGVACWQTGLGIPDYAAIGKNTTGGVFRYGTLIVPTDGLYIDPESYTAILSFTAPQAGTYSIAGDFTGVDTNENSHPVQILDNGVSIFNNTIGSYGQDDPFNLIETLNPGDTIDFEVLTGSTGCSYCDLSTGLDVTIGQVLEPASFSLLGGALVAFGSARRRRIRTAAAEQS
jgi:hypothetical protein